MSRNDRKGFIGASQVAACLGLSHWSTPEETRQAIVEGQWDESAPLSPAWWGHQLEDDIVEGLEAWCQSEDGLCCVQATAERWAGPSLVHPVYQWLVATPDALVRSPLGVALGECKAALRALRGDDDHQWGDADESLPALDWHRWGIPVVYAVQTMTQMGVARACGWKVEWCFVAVLGLRYRPFEVYTVEFSQEAWDWILDRLVTWHARHIVAGEPCPPHTPAEANGSRQPARETVLVSAEMETLLRRRCELADGVKDANAEIAAIDCEVLTAIGDGAVLYGPTGRIGTWSRSFRPDQKWRQA